MVKEIDYKREEKSLKDLTMIDNIVNKQLCAFKIILFYFRVFFSRIPWYSVLQFKLLDFEDFFTTLFYEEVL